MYKLLLALALTTANQEYAEPSGGLRGLRFAPFVNTDKGGPEASACLRAGGDCAKCCGGCNPKDPINDGTDFREEAECVCFEASFDSDVSVHLSDHDDCANVVRQGDAQVTIKGEDGVDAIHMASPDASDESYSDSPGEIYVWTGVALVARGRPLFESAQGNGGVDHLTCVGNGHQIFGEEYYSWDDKGDGGNFLSCTGDYNKIDGGADCDDITCNGKKCYVDGRAGNDLLKVDYDYVEKPNYQGNYGDNTGLLSGGDGIDKCVYNGGPVILPGPGPAYYGIPGRETCEDWAEFPDPAC